MRTHNNGRAVRTLVVASIAVATAAVLGTPAASATPGCPGAGQAPVLVGRVPGGSLEGATVDPQGRLYVTDIPNNRVVRFDAPGAAPVTVAQVPSPGALAWTPDGSLLIGTGADPRVFVGDVVRHATIVRMNIATGAVTPFASGLSAADGLDVARDGTVYATNDFGSLVARIAPNGAVQADWARVPSMNGAVLSSDDRYLYASRTFAEPGVDRIPVANPGAVEHIVDFGGGGVLKAADGLTLDSRDRPIVPTDVSGEILRVDGPGQVCTLATGLPLSDVVTYGRSDRGFAKGRLFRAGFDGAIYEIPGAFDPDATTAAP